MFFDDISVLIIDANAQLALASMTYGYSAEVVFLRKVTRDVVHLDLVAVRALEREGILLIRGL